MTRLEESIEQLELVIKVILLAGHYLSVERITDIESKNGIISGNCFDSDNKKYEFSISQVGSTLDSKE